MADHLDPGDKNLQEAPLDQGDPQNEPNPPCYSTSACKSDTFWTGK